MNLENKQWTEQCRKSLSIANWENFSNKIPFFKAEDEDKPLKPKAPVDDRCKKCIFLEMTCIHSESYMEKIKQMRRDRGLDTEEEEEVEDVVSFCFLHIIG